MERADAETPRRLAFACLFLRPPARKGYETATISVQTRRLYGRGRAVSLESAQSRDRHLLTRRVRPAMTDFEKCRPAPERAVRAWLAAFERDPPLHTLFPLPLKNGKSIPGVHVVCSACGGRLSGDRVRGRVTQPLPHVRTVTANAMCTLCNRVTHVDFRFRTDTATTVVEWLASNGHWQARPMQPPSVRARVVDAFRRLLNRLSSRSS